MEKINNCLQELSISAPHAVRTGIKLGDKISKSLGIAYEIDDISISASNSNTTEYWAIHNALKSDKRKILEAYGNNRVIPFSKVVKLGVGECLEKAVLLQLALQRKERTSFLINGCLELDEGYGIPHAFNILIGKQGNPVLVDVENPLETSQGLVHCVCPIIDIQTEYGDITLPEEYRFGRKYSIF